MFVYSDLMLVTREDEPGRCNVLQSPLFLRQLRLQDGVCALTNPSFLFLGVRDVDYYAATNLFKSQKTTRNGANVHHVNTLYFQTVLSVTVLNHICLPIL